MKKINVNYAHVNKSWEIGYILKALGFTRTANAYWVETYANAENSVEVCLHLEERKPETAATEWQSEVLNAAGLVLGTYPTASSNHRFWAITEGGEILHIMPEGAEWEDAGEMLDRYIEAGHFEAGITGIFDKMPEEPEEPEEKPECHWFDFGNDNEAFVTDDRAAKIAQDMANKTGKIITYIRFCDGEEFNAYPPTEEPTTEEQPTEEQPTEEQTADNQTTEQAEDTAEQQTEEQAAAETANDAETETQQATSIPRTFSASWALKCAVSDFGDSAREFLDFNPLEFGIKNVRVEWDWYDRDGKHSDFIIAVGVKNYVSARTIATLATFGTCGKKLRYIDL